MCPECAKDRRREYKDRNEKREEKKSEWDKMLERTVWLPEVSNPMLLSVKMFLADVIYMVNKPYDYDEHNCAQFAKEIQDAASEKGLRCGYVVISFTDSKIGHAIVAFETDYGIKFFEPQSAEEEDVVIGRCYSTRASGIAEDHTISRVEISWNDGTKTIIE